MKKIILILFMIVACTLISYTQSNKIVFHKNGNTVYNNYVSEIDSIKLINSNAYINSQGLITTLFFSDFDSITFLQGDTTLPEPKDSTIYIVYMSDTAKVVNSMENNGVSVTVSGANVTVNATSGYQDLQYVLSGSTENGSFTITSDKRFTFVFNGVYLQNSIGAAINVTNDKKVSVTLNNTNTLIDGSNNSLKGAFYSKSQIIFSGDGILNISGNKKNGIHSDDYIKVESGTINITSAIADGIHCDYFVMDNGVVNINSVGGDGIDGDEGYIEINGGSVTIVDVSEDVSAMKCDSIITINGGEINLTVAGEGSKCIKSKQSIYINGGSITLVASGNASKGFSASSDVLFAGGTVNVIASGSVVLEESGSGYDPSYCSAVKADGNIEVTAGSITMNCTSANKGGKGFSANGNIIISGGTINATTAGNGATYTDTIGTLDSYTASCIKADGNITILKGNITISSSGTGGKGISADTTIVLGVSGASNDSLVITGTTSGAHFLVSGDDYANPKCIKGGGNVTINSGTFVINCTQSTEGGECIESKAVLTINGGDLYVYSIYDDAINASTGIVFNGGTIYCKSDHNDAVDSNGTLIINGGMIVVNGSRTPEAGFDCDQNTFSITGGTAIGTGGDESTPTTSACTQRVIVYNNATAGNAISITRNSDNTVILIYQLPTFVSGGGPGGQNSMKVLFTDNAITIGSYTLHYGGTISGGTSYHGYYTGATYSGGSSTNFTVSEMVTTVGGGGWK